jgi:hypothetical protein
MNTFAFTDGELRDFLDVVLLPILLVALLLMAGACFKK